VNAQKDAAVSASKQTEAKVATYVGGETAMRRFIASTLKYPVIAEENGEQGTVVVGFTVEEDGSLTNIHIEKSVSEWLDKEAKRIVSKMPKWQPAQSGGVNVKSEQTVIVTFILQ
jgi:protein TonB